jgi:hypothetical protein
LVDWTLFKHFVPTQEDYNFEEALLQQKVFDSILVANKVYFETHDLYELDTYENVWFLMLKQQLYLRNVGPMMKDGAVKIYLFRNFILNYFPNGKELIKEFKANLGLKHSSTMQCCTLEL